MSEEKTQNKNKDESKIQELYMQLNMINQQTNELQKQIQSLEETILEITESKKSLDEIKKAEKGKEILVPIVSGIFAKAELKDTKEFIVNVGASAAVSKSSEDVQKLLDQQLVQMQETQNQFVGELQQLTIKAKVVEAGLKDFMVK